MAVNALPGDAQVLFVYRDNDAGVLHLLCLQPDAQYLGGGRCDALPPLFSRLGLPIATITRIFSLSIATNWLGYILLGGLVFISSMVPLPRAGLSVTARCASSGRYYCCW